MKKRIVLELTPGEMDVMDEAIGNGWGDGDLADAGYWSPAQRAAWGRMVDKVRHAQFNPVHSPTELLKDLVDQVILAAGDVTSVSQVEPEFLGDEIQTVLKSAPFKRALKAVAQ